MILDIVDKRKWILSDTIAYGFYQFISHHFIRFSDLFFIRFKVSLNVLLEHSLVESLEVFIGVQLRENFFVFHTSEFSHDFLFL